MPEWTARSLAMVRQIRWRLDTAPWPQLAASRFFRSTWDRCPEDDRTHVLAQLAWAARHCTTLVPADGEGMRYAARLHRDAQLRAEPRIMPGPRPSVEDQLKAALILAASERTAALSTHEAPERALPVILDAADQAPGPVLDRWAALPEPTRAAAMSHLAWTARRAAAPHEPTDTAGRLAHWLRDEAQLWEDHIRRLGRVGQFRAPLAQIGECALSVQLEAAVRLLTAGRTGTLPPSPYMCGCCGYDRALTVVRQPTPSGPPRARLLCEMCVLLGDASVDPSPHTADRTAASPRGRARPPTARE
ncbi:hypothetical protein ACF1DY_31750 [Streptomyces albus]|uniref:hypothetical protein n=1 Tax=Streptomyces albus TaxID=1888 RepID=UPI0036F5EF59